MIMKLATVPALAVAYTALNLVNAIIFVPVPLLKDGNGTKCSYFNETLEDGVTLVSGIPCEKIKCFINDSKVQVWGCPPPKGEHDYIGSSFTLLYPKCCKSMTT
uniref:8.9 kDa family member n=1 Tax=Rhipicephalus appendiculatus TaxID=34631 RepID=A0A131YU76_RHIAP